MLNGAWFIIRFLLNITLINYFINLIYNTIDLIGIRKHLFQIHFMETID